MKTKRIFAYIIDFLIISFISTIIFQIAFKTSSYNEYQEKTEQYLKDIMNSGSNEYTEKDLINIMYDINKAQIPLEIIEFGITIFYFGIISYIANGKTLGKKIFKIRVVPTKGQTLNPALYFLREIILTNSIFTLAGILAINFASSASNWYLINNIITNGKTIVTIALLGFLIFREDERSLHDIICQTKVIEEK